MAESRKKLRKSRNCLAEILGEFLLQFLPYLIFSGVGGSVYAAYLIGGIGLALMLIPLWVWLFYRWGGRIAAAWEKRSSRRDKGGGLGR